MEKKIISVSKRVNSLSHIQILDPNTISNSSAKSQSPIYRVTDGEVLPPLDEFKNGFVLFLYIPSLFGFLRKIKDFNDKDSISFWISNGLANLVIISDNENDLLHLKNSIVETGKVNAFELWTINDSKLTSQTHEVYNSYESKEIDLDLTSFSDELVLISREFLLGIVSIIEKSALYSSSAEDHYEKIRGKGITLIEKAATLETKKIINPTIHDDSLYASYISDLVELNSVISYSLTQGLAGTPPILENPAVIQSYSLLGIGTNYQGYYALYKHVHSIFSRFNISSIMNEQYSSDHGYRLGKVERKTLNNQISKGAENSDMEHLLYFSGRLGFRESKNAISAALFCISLGATNKWNLLTFSHEYMHAHVRDILATILWPEKFSKSESYENIGNSEFQIISDKYNEFIQNNNIDGKFTTLDCLAFSIIRFYQNIEFYAHLSLRVEQGQAIENEYKEDSKEVSPSWIKSTIQQPGNWKLLNELMVHVLDYQYFYDGNNSIYIPVLWESWSTVPQVRGNLHIYILRTLASLCSNTSYNSKLSQPKNESQSQRFNISLRELKEQLELIIESGNGTSLIEEALKFINSEKSKNRLKSMLISSMGLIDDIMSILHHPSIHASIIHDPLSSAVNSYPFDNFEFSGVIITSPVLFLQNQVKKQETEVNTIENEAMSIWNALACISSIENDRGN